MRIIFLLTAIVMCGTNLHAQFSLTPKWQAGQTQLLDLSYSKHTLEKGKPETLDTTHAQIKVTFIKEDDYFYFLEWQFESYYEDTSNPEKVSEKMMYQVIANLVKQAPIKFRIEKEDQSIKIMNRQALDGMTDSLSATVAAAFSKDKKADSTAMFGPASMLSFLIAVKIEDKLYKLIDRYYGVYRQKKLDLNRRYSLEELDKEKAETAAKMMSGYEGYSMLDDSSANSYTYTMTYKADMAKMMSSLANSLSDVLDKDKKKKGGKKGKDKDIETIGSEESAFMETTTIYKLDKLNRLVIQYLSVESSDMNNSLTTTKEKETLLIKKVR